MKEFIEKLIKGISNKKDYFQRLYECEGKTEHDADLNKATQLAFDDCLSVIEQLAEEYNNDFCEWFKYDYRTIAPKSHDAGNPYWRIPENMDKLKHCPYCGKKNKGGGVMNKLLDSLHKKILKSKFAEEVTEAEIDALVEAKEYNGGWIPCSERLPEIDGNTSDVVLVCTVDGFQHMAFWCDDKKWRYCESGMIKNTMEWTEIIAWQPLPAPYQLKGE